jgi:hypothetical protein
LVEELLGLEAKPTPGGLTRIAAAGSGHDDRAVVVAALAEELLKRRTSLIVAPLLMYAPSMASIADGTATSDGDHSNELQGQRDFGAGTPLPESTIPPGAVCLKCGCTNFKPWDAKCVRCDAPYPTGRRGEIVLMPVLMSKIALR